MSTLTTNDYFLQKTTLLKQCLSLSEELISSLEQWEDMAGILERREAVLQQLNELEESTSTSVKSLLSREKADETDQIIRLILALDSNTAELIRKEKENIANSIKANAQEQRLMEYATPQLSRGKRFDYKK